MRVPSLHTLTLRMNGHESRLEMRFHFQAEPDLEVKAHRARLAAPLVEGMGAIGAALWGTDRRFRWSSVELCDWGREKYHHLAVISESHGMPAGRWGAIEIVLSLVDRYSLGPLAPHRLELYVSCHEKYSPYDDEYVPAARTDDAAAWIDERRAAVASLLVDLLRLTYDPCVCEVDLSHATWDDDGAPWEGGEGFRLSGVVLRDPAD